MLISRVKFITLAIKRVEGWHTEAVYSLLRAGRFWCPSAGWWWALAHVHVLNFPFPAEEWAHTYGKCTHWFLVLSGTALVGTGQVRAHRWQNRTGAWAASVQLACTDIARQTSYLACVHMGKLWQMWELANQSFTHFLKFQNITAEVISVSLQKRKKTSSNSMECESCWWQLTSRRNCACHF